MRRVSSLIVLSAVVLSLVPTTHAHLRLFGLSVDGEDKGVGCDEVNYGQKIEKQFIRCPSNDNPVIDLASDHVACNTNGAVEKNFYVPVRPGQRITFQWGHNKRSKDDPADIIIAPEHVGPMMVYFAPVEGATTKQKVWKKLWESAGTEPGNWAVTQFIAAKGLHWIEVPKVKPGKYLFRPEIIALHSAWTDPVKNPGKKAEPQLYMACAQIEVQEGNDGGVPKDGDEFKVAFPGAYPTDQPGQIAAGLEFSVYKNPANAVTDYKKNKLPGPPVCMDSPKGGFGEGTKDAKPTRRLRRRHLYQEQESFD